MHYQLGGETLFELNFRQMHFIIHDQSGIFARNLTHIYNKPFFLYEGVKIKRFFFFIIKVQSPLNLLLPISRPYMDL